MSKSKTEVLTALVHLSKPLDELQQELALLEWDTNPGGVELTPAALSAVLVRYLEGHLTADQVRQWAKLTEVRDDLATAQVVQRALFELANSPFITTPLDANIAKLLLDTLK